MSDVTVAPSASPPPSNAPTPAAAAEVPINPNPTHTPAPVGSQAPDKPPPSRREVIQAAFDKAQAERPKPEPRKARMGDNNPPEPMEREKPAKADRPPPLDLKKRPADQPAAPTRSEPQPREQGRFAPRATPENGSQSDATRAAQQQPVQRANPLPEHAPYRAAPPRMSEHAKAEWAAAPESVRGEVHRMHAEFAKAYERYRGDHETMNTIRPFHQMAQQHGTTLDKALSNYVNMEHKLRNDVVGGLDVIINNLNLRAPNGEKLTLQDVAWHIVNQTPEQHKLLQSQNTMMAQSHQMAQMRQEQQALAQELRRMQYAAQFNQTRGALDQFAEEHPRLDELGDLIEQEIKLGFGLDDAYRRAELLRPAGPHAAQTRNGTHAAQTRTPTAQTRTSDRSISGAPGSPSNGRARDPGKQVGRRDAIANAIKRVNGAL